MGATSDQMREAAAETQGDWQQWWGGANPFMRYKPLSLRGPSSPPESLRKESRWRMTRSPLGWAPPSTGWSHRRHTKKTTWKSHLLLVFPWKHPKKKKSRRGEIFQGEVRLICIVVPSNLHLEAEVNPSRQRRAYSPDRTNFKLRMESPGVLVPWNKSLQPLPV